MSLIYNSGNKIRKAQSGLIVNEDGTGFVQEPGPEVIEPRVATPVEPGVPNAGMSEAPGGLGDPEELSPEDLEQIRQKGEEIVAVREAAIKKRKIKNLQVLLGFEGGEVDGIWGPKTKKAFERAKEMQGEINSEMGEGEEQLVIDGIRGPKTDAAFRKYIQKKHHDLLTGKAVIVDAMEVDGPDTLQAPRPAVDKTSTRNLRKQLRQKNRGERKTARKDNRQMKRTARQVSRGSDTGVK